MLRSLHFSSLLILALGVSISEAAGPEDEWRAIQRRYNDLATAQGRPTIDVFLREIVQRELGTVDRCVTCHVTHGDVAPLEGDRFFAAHPEIPHDPSEFGCSVCHGGQGKLTQKGPAHGADVWPDPLLGRNSYEAGCGTCHSAIAVGRPELVAEGARLFRERGCNECHTVSGRGGGDRDATLDLSAVGIRGVPSDWYGLHVRTRLTRVDGRLEGFRAMPDLDQVEAITEYLSTQVGMPRLATGKQLSHQRGCLGCHRVDGVGGDDGSDLSAFGLRPLRDFPFPEDWEGERSRERWLREVLHSPEFLAPASTMPHLELPSREIDDLALYLLSLRRRELPLAWTPPDRLRRERLGERDFPTDGRTLYVTFCAACHGDHGEGRRDLLDWSVPAVTNADFLSIASDDFLRYTLLHGRRDRRMPAWSPERGGLEPREIDALVRYLRSFEPTPPSFADVRAAAVDLDLGRQIYEWECVACHGERSEGGIAPSHRNPAFRALVTDRFLYTTLVEGRPGTGMPSYRELSAPILASLIAHLRVLADAPAPEVDLLTRDVPLGNARAGRTAYAEHCQSCHGPEGLGDRGPAIGNWAFLRAAGPLFVIESYLRKRCRNEQGQAPPFVDPGPLADVVAYLEEMAARPGLRLAGPTIRGDADRGEERYGATCAPCHGVLAEGGEAPSLANPDFLAAASDGFLFATIVRGHRTAGMPGFEPGEPEPDLDQMAFPRLTEQEIEDIVAYLRSLAPAGR